MDVGSRVYGGRRCKAREKSGAGKTVRDLTRMAVVVSGWRRCGLNWYLDHAPHSPEMAGRASLISAETLSI